MSSAYVCACERNVKETAGWKKMKDISPKARSPIKKASINEAMFIPAVQAVLVARAPARATRTFSMSGDDYFLTGILGRKLAFSPRCTFATFVLMDLIGSSPKSDR
ncbi:hypothetical protein [Pseudomonas citrulli]|uniref:Uncharacterized protein n=1 Tax=Pseudomonas citrulli TaxID=3064347 RepID=A0ABT9C2C5_9PSED|nr:hypothetical protein [Pseudomonas sp. K18]MDO7898330.1 hypothetical protein [Pseudomonas sp. K18]